MPASETFERVVAAFRRLACSKRSLAVVAATVVVLASVAALGYRAWAGEEEREKVLIADPAADGRGYVVISFDDGSKSVYQYGLPIMSAAGVPGTVFVVTDAISKSYEGRPCMTPDELRALQAAGWEVGSHSKSHADFSLLSPEQADYELRESKAALEAIGINGTTFAYPWGRVDHADVPIADKYYERQRSGYGPMDDRALYLPDYSPGLPMVGSVTPTSLQHAKDLIDKAIETDSVIIFLLHDVTPSGNLTTAVQDTNLQDVVDYIMEKRESDGLQAITFDDLPTTSPVSYVWDGGGADDLASTPQNWYKVVGDGTVVNDAPLVSDAHFIWNATSSKNATWDLDADDITAHSLTIAPGYQGKVQQGAADIGIGRGGFYQGGGAFEGNKDMSVYNAGPVTVINGTFMGQTVNWAPPEWNVHDNDKPWWSGFGLSAYALRTGD